MERGGGDDNGCHLDHADVSSGQPTMANKKVDNCGPPSHGAFVDDDHINPFQVHVILDVLFKLLPFEDAKKCRLVSSTWNDVGTFELSKRHQKPIKFSRIDELENDDKLGELVQLYHHQPFSNFSFNIPLLSSPQIDTFLQNFTPKFVQLNGESRGVYNHQIKDLVNFLIKISRFVEEIEIEFKYNFNYLEDKGEDCVGQLSSISFPNLRKISCNILYFGLKTFLYSLIGQNSPKLRHLELGSITEESYGSPAFMKEQFKTTGLFSKLQILSLIPAETELGQDYLKLFTEFGQNGLLKLTKLKIDLSDTSKREQFKTLFAPLIASQAENLKILEISTPPYSGIPHGTPRIQVPFPSLPNLTILQIDYFSLFEANFSLINFNFSIQLPKLVEFRTRDIVRFLSRKMRQGRDGDSVKSVKLLKDSYAPKNLDALINCFDLVFHTFPYLEFLEVDAFNYLPRVPFRSQLRKVVIHSELKDLYFLRKELLQDAEKVEIFVDCGSKLSDEESYKEFLGGIMMQEFKNEGQINSDLFNRNKYYHKFLERISQDFSSLHSVSVTFIGYKISEDFKRDFRAAIPHSTFISCPFQVGW